MDVVYVLGIGSPWQDNELRYSLRSVQQYLKDFDRVFIVGERPAWLQNIVHVPCRDGSQKERNIMEKILKVCATDVSDDFFFLNDDHFLLQETSTINFPYYYTGTLEETASTRHYMKPYTHSLRNTQSALMKNNYPQNYYDIHTPIVYSKKDFSIVMAMYNWKIPYCYTIKSLYTNTQWSIQGTEYTDCKIDKRYSLAQIEEMIAERFCFSIGNGALTQVMKNFLETRYPNKSKYEK